MIQEFHIIFFLHESSPFSIWYPVYLTFFFTYFSMFLYFLQYTLSIFYNYLFFLGRSNYFVFRINMTSVHVLTISKFGVTLLPSNQIKCHQTSSFAVATNSDLALLCLNTCIINLIFFGSCRTAEKSEGSKKIVFNSWANCYPRAYNPLSRTAFKYNCIY